jgi:hypothetical protein
LNASPNQIERLALCTAKFVPGEDVVARNAYVAAKLLRDAAQFFLAMESAEVYEAVADLVEEDPEGDLEDDEG